MTGNLHDSLREAFVDEEEDICSADELLERARSHRRRTRQVLPAAAAAFVIAVGLCVAAIIAHGARDKTASPPARSAAITPAPVGHAVTVRIALDHASYPANGTPIAAVAVITNTTGKRVEITGGCNAWFFAILVNRRFPSREVAAGGVGCPHPTYLPVGVTRQRISILTTVRVCTEGPPHADTSSPACAGTHHDQMPRFTPGIYHVVVVGQQFKGVRVVTQTGQVTLTKV